MTQAFWSAVGVINLAAFLLMGLDKAKACLDRRRIPERTLLLPGALFGSVGVLLGMLVFRHKIRKPYFRNTVLACLIVQVILLVVFLFTGLTNHLN